MKRFLFLTIVLLVFCSPAFAWHMYADGSALPDGWVTDLPTGSTTLATAFDGSAAIRISSGSQYREYADAPNIPDVAVGGVRFSVVDFTGMTGFAGILSVDPNPTGGQAPAIAIALRALDGHFWVMNQQGTTRLFDLGVATTDVFHTAYIQASMTNVIVNWDGQNVYTADNPTLFAADAGWVEWGANQYWKSGHPITVDFNWVGSGGVSDFPTVPEPSSLAVMAFSLVGFAGAVLRRRK